MTTYCTKCLNDVNPDPQGDPDSAGCPHCGNDLYRDTAEDAGMLIGGNTFSNKKEISESGALWWAEKKMWVLPTVVTPKQHAAFILLWKQAEKRGLVLNKYANPAEYDTSPDPRIAYL